MGFLARVLGGTIGETVKGVSQGVSSLALNLRKAITGKDPALDAQLEKMAIEAEMLSQQGQMAINKIEAGHHSVFVAGWRPFIGWTCGIAIFYNYILYGFIEWIVAVFAPDVVVPARMTMTELWPVIIGMLGLGAARSFEKNRGVQGRH